MIFRLLLQRRRCSLSGGVSISDNTIRSGHLHPTLLLRRFDLPATPTLSGGTLLFVPSVSSRHPLRISSST
ncbi:hypothetical protein L1887_04740 [Cichorium endivia]|nr:hypothetical protein L1887_04740 [Cichorium endivia]